MTAPRSQSLTALEDLQHATLEVLAFGQPEQDRVVAALLPPRYQPDRPADIPGGVPEHAAKLLGGKVIGAGAGDQKRAGAEKPHRPEVDLLVAGQGFRYPVVRLDERRTIEDDHVEGFAPAVVPSPLVQDGADAGGAPIRPAVPFRRGQHLLAP